MEFYKFILIFSVELKLGNTLIENTRTQKNTNYLMWFGYKTMSTLESSEKIPLCKRELLQLPLINSTHNPKLIFTQEHFRYTLFRNKTSFSL